MKKGIVGFIVLILLLGAGFAIYENSKDYIDGNVLHFPYFEEHAVKGSGYTPAWIDNAFVNYLLFKPIILPSADMSKFNPVLVKSFTVSEDYLTYIFECHDNLKWSDGEPLTIDDIYFCLKYAKNIAVDTLLLQDLFKNIDSITTNDNTLIIQLNERHANFLLALSQFPIYPKHIFANITADFKLEEYWKTPVCSGMYIVTEVNDKYNKLEPNPYYVGQKPKIAEILLHKDPNAKLDSYFSTNIADIISFRAMRGYTEFPLELAVYRYFAFNIQDNDGYVNDAMNNFDIRATIANAIDNQKIIQSIFLNTGETFSSDERHVFNKDKAIEHLELSNYDLNRPLKLGHYYEDTTSLYFVQAIVDDLEEIGFKVEIIKGNSPEDLVNKRNFDIMLKDNVMLSPMDWAQELTSDHLYARIFGVNPELDLLVNEARREMNPAKQEEMLKNTDRTAARYLSRYPIVKLNQTIYLSQRINLPKGFKFSNPWYMTDLEFEKWEIKKQ